MVWGWLAAETQGNVRALFQVSCWVVTPGVVASLTNCWSPTSDEKLLYPSFWLECDLYEENMRLIYIAKTILKNHCYTAIYTILEPPPLPTKQKQKHNIGVCLFCFGVNNETSYVQSLLSIKHLGHPATWALQSQRTGDDIWAKQITMSYSSCFLSAEQLQITVKNEDI